MAITLPSVSESAQRRKKRRKIEGEYKLYQCFSLQVRTHLERAHQGLVDAHHRARVIELAAVVRCGKQRDQLPLGEELVAVFDHLRASM